MSHQTPKSFLKLQKRLDKNAQGAPASDSLFGILQELFNEEEATKTALIPIKPFTVETMMKRWKISKEKAQKTLNDLADKGILFDLYDGKKQTYVVAPTMAGFFEFSLMRSDGKFNNKLLSELYHQYINEEDDFIAEALMQKTGICRTFVHESSIKNELQSEIMNYERATEVINQASAWAVGTCYCRHKMEHIGKACDMPQDVCLTFNNAAKTLTKHGIAKKLTKEEAHAKLKQCIDLGLVQIGDNTRDHVGWICNCCGCCCEALLAYKRLNYDKKINSNWYASINNEKCTGCGVCAQKCPVDAIEIINKQSIVNLDKCIGCGVCKRFCGINAIEIERRDKTMFIPKDSFERCVLNAIEKGKLQNYIFDNYGLWTNEIMRHLLGVLLKLSGSKFLIANKQIRSRFVSTLRKVRGAETFRKIYEK